MTNTSELMPKGQITSSTKANYSADATLYDATLYSVAERLRRGGRPS